MPDDEAGKGSKKVKKLISLLQNKRLLLAGGSVLAVLILAGVYICFFNQRAPGLAAGDSFNETSAVAEDKNAEVVEVLPQPKREIIQLDDELWFGQDPFASPMKLTGTINGGRGGAMAIVESGNAAYIVSAGDVIDELWYVVYIENDSVLLSSAERDVRLRLHGGSVSKPTE